MLAPPETADPQRRSARVASFGTARIVSALFFVAGTVLAIWLGLYVLGPAGALILLGGWSLAAACHLVIPGLRGTVSWAAGVLLEVGMLGVLSALSAKLSPQQHGPVGNLVVLVVPVVAAGAALAVGLWRDRRSAERGPTSADRAAESLDPEPSSSDSDWAPPDEPRISARPGIALAVIVAGLALVARISADGHLYGAAWAMSGDARNHVVFVRSILLSGGLTINLLRDFPGLMDAIAALISGGNGRSNLAPGQLFVHDGQALASTYVLAGLAIATLGIAALLEFLSRAVAARRYLPLATYLALLASTGLSVTGLVLGTALRDGYVSAYATIPLTLAAIVLGLACCREGTAAAYVLLGPAVVLALFSWTILAVAPAAVTVVVTVLLAIRGRGRLSTTTERRTVPLGWVGAVLVTCGCLLGSAGVVLTHLTLLRATFKDTGAITPPNVQLVYVLGFVAAGGALGARRRLDRLQMLIPLSAAVAGGLSLVWLMGLSPDHKSWTYYGLKQLWLLASCLVWMLFLPIVRSSAGPWALGSRPTLVRLGRLLQAAAWSLAALIAVGQVSPLPGPLTLARHGWNQPSASVIADMATAADYGRPTILWGWSDPGNERLGNFWGALAWGYTSTETIVAYPPALPGGIVYWAYFEQGREADLCAAVQSVPQLVVVTHAKTLGAILKKSCKGSRATVVTSPGQRP
jgi:hypothetical protein